MRRPFIFTSLVTLRFALCSHAHAAQSLLVTPTVGQPREFYRWKMSRP